MDRVISLLLALTFAAACMFAWDRHPPVHYQAPWYLLHARLGLPDSLQTKLDQQAAAATAAARGEARARADLEDLKTQLAASNARAEAEAHAAEAAIAHAESVAAEARKGRARTEAKAQKLQDAIGHLSGDVCADISTADAAVMGDLK